MTTTGGEPALLDTNVLLDATDTRRPRHGAVLAILGQGRNLLISAQIVREYLVVATRPVPANGLGMGLEDALGNMEEFRKVARLLPEEKPVLPRFLALVREVGCRGKKVHDAFVVATMVVHDVKTLVTSNPGDFSRFGDLVNVVEP